MTAEVVTRLIVDASGAKVGTDVFIAQMRKAQQSAEEWKGKSERSVNSVTRAFENLQGKTDPVYKAQISAQREMVKAQELATKAVVLGVRSQSQADAVLVALAKRHADYIKQVRNGTVVQADHARSLGIVGTAAQELEGRMQTAAGTLGMAGAVMTSMGPIGLALAATLGAVAIGFTLAAKESLRLADDLGKMRDQAETTGVSFEGLQGLQKIAAEAGVGVDKFNAFLERFTVGLEEAKDAQGDFYTQILKINPALASQITVAKGAEDALYLLAKAYQKADDEIAKARLMKAAGGKNAVAVGRMMDSVANAGGVAGTAALINPRDIVSEQVSKTLDDLGDKIAYVFNTARNNIVLAFGKPVLETLDDITEQFIAFSREVRNWKSPEELRAFLKDWIKEAAQDVKALLGLIADIATGIGAAIRFIREQRQQHAGSVDAQTGNVNPASVGMFGESVPGVSTVRPPSYIAANFPTETMRGTSGLMEDIEAARLAVKRFANAIANDSGENIGRLATQSQQAQRLLAEKRRELFLSPSIDTFTGGASFEPPAKRSAAAEANLASARVEFLGGAATDAERQQAAILKLTAAYKDNKGSAEDFTRAQKALAESFSLSITQARVSLGVATESEVVEAQLLRTRQALDKAGITGARERAQAEEIALRAAKEQNEQLRIRQSIYPQLTRWAIESADITKQMDKFGVNSLNTFTDGILNMAEASQKGSDAVKAAFSSMATSIIKDLARIMIQKSLTSMLFGGGGGLLGMFGGGGGPGLLPTTNLGFGGPTAGLNFDSGGYTGPGGKNEPAGIVHKGEVVWSQDDVQRHGGPALVDTMRRDPARAAEALRKRTEREAQPMQATAARVALPIQPMPAARREPTRVWDQSRPFAAFDDAQPRRGRDAAITSSKNSNDLRGIVQALNVFVVAMKNQKSNVTVSVDKNGNLQAYVKDVAKKEAATAASSAFTAMDKSLPDRMKKIKRDPWKR